MNSNDNSSGSKKATHDPHEKTHTLTCPDDMPANRQIETLDPSVPDLTPVQLQAATAELYDTTFITRFPRVERRLADTPIPIQTFGLFSFTPAKGAKPNESGIYGMAKIRGVFATDKEAEKGAADLLKNDSYNKIYATYVGRPFPVTLASTFSAVVDEIDLEKEAKKIYADHVRNEREKEQREIEEIKEREKNLLADVQTEEDPYERYTVLKTKKAQLTWTYLETEKKVEQMRTLIAKARKEIEELEEKHTDAKDKFFDKYLEARRQANLPTDRDVLQNSFMRFMVEDAVIPAVDEEYRKLYESEE